MKRVQSTVCYLIQNEQWLLLLRNKKKQDVNHNKWIGVGGKNLLGESFRDCAIRETFEETGYTMVEPEYRGMIYFEYADKDSEQIAVYSCSCFTGEPIECNEGTLAWIPESEILQLDLWEGDRTFLKKMLNHESQPFCYLFRYDANGTLIEQIEKEAETDE